jgi:hypothetical protein
MSSANPFDSLTNENFSHSQLNQLRLLEFPNKNSKIIRNRLSDPFVMNNGRQNEPGKYIGKYMILAHGSVMEGFTFLIPKNINIVTLVKVGHNSPADKYVDDSIKKLYKNGDTLFQKNDLGRDLTQAGKNLLEELQRRHPGGGFEFKNHKGGVIANEMFLNFNRDASKEGTVRGIGIKDLLKNSNQIKNIANLYNSSSQYQIKQILLSSLLSMYDEQTIRGRENINKVFIIRACRGFQRKGEWAGHLFAGNTSRRAQSRNEFPS